MKNISIAILIILLFYACNSDYEEKVNYSLEQKIYSQIFPELVDTLLYLVVLEDEFQNLPLEDRKEIIYQERMNVYVDSNLYPPDSTYLIEFDNDYLLRQFRSDSLVRLVKSYPKLGIDTTSLNLDELWDGGRYKILSLDYDSVPYQYPNKIGIVFLSQILFNEKKNFGCFYYTFYRDPDTSVGFLVTIKLKNDEWSIQDYYHLWIS
ncbi:MAG: hypothetical protein QY331_06850 [Melioribacteraceae bacterium]|nr:MAG: hypothetical protein QY331_06850 [Melioribacteraceae bacterium]